MTETRKNQFEEIIDAMMIEEVAGLDSELKLKLEGLPLDKKRIGILSILDKDRGLFMKIMKMVNENHVSKTEHIKQLLEMMREYVKVGEVEKKTLGEVMTPQFLVNDMLDTLPQEVWSNPSLKFLDPCSGVGIFSSVIVDRLMNGLSEHFSNDEERYRHIIENMLYVGELQPKNTFLHLCSFDPKDEYDLNVYCGSFLDEGFDNHMKNVWGIEKFDVIVMNPPYQELKEGNTKSQTLWDKFVIKTINHLVEGGYLVPVHPEGWRNIGKQFETVRNLLKSKQILSLEIHDYSDGLKTFGAKTTYDFYCLKNIPCETETKIKCMDGTTQMVDISKIPFIPNGMFNEFEKLIALPNQEKVNLIVDSSYHTQRIEHMSKLKTEEFKYPCVYTSLSTDVINFWYSNVDNKGHFNVPKVIWTNGTASKPIIDSTGEYGLTQFAYAIADDVDNLINIQKAMLNPRFINLMNFRDGNGGKFGHRYDKNVVSLFRKDFWKEFLD
jgi:hypothetical protein